MASATYYIDSDPVFFFFNLDRLPSLRLNSNLLYVFVVVVFRTIVNSATELVYY